MQPVSLALGFLVGGGLSAVLVLLWSQRSSGRLAEELQQARAELQKNKTTAEQLKTTQQGEAEAKRQLEAYKSKVSSLERAVATHIKELSELKAAIGSAETARDQALEQANAHHASRQQAEGRLKQAERLASDSAKKLEELMADFKRAQQESTSLGEVVKRRGEEIKRLRAEMEQGRGGSDLESSVELFADAEGSLRQILDILVSREALQAAVLADSRGMVVASAGDEELRDGIAAAAQLFSKTSSTFDGMLPFGALQAFSVRDGQSVVIAGRTFDASGEQVALCTYGSRPPSERALDGAMASLSAALE